MRGDSARRRAGGCAGQNPRCSGARPLHRLCRPGDCRRGEWRPHHRAESLRTDKEEEIVMRGVWAVAAACALAACSQGGVASGGPTKEAVAAKIVDAQGVLDLGDSTLKEVINGQIQAVGFDHPSLTPEQAE